MNANGLFSDPAIIGLSNPNGAIGGDDSASKKAGLEPGSALSKLLDSAMANAAKEVTPEPETGSESRSGEQSPSKSNRSSFQSFVPQEKTDLSKIYSINSLLELRSSPAVLDFDVSRLPEPTFWRARQKGQEGHNSNGKNNNNHHHHNNNGHSSGGTGKRTRRNNQLAAAAAAAAATSASDSLNWERKPAGFLKNSDIDHMSTEKISQLLGEAPEEETPDWDLPGSNADLRMDMGSTVEDFERWKSHMRQEEKRKHGDNEPYQEVEDTAPSNEVDSFFSFAKPKEITPDNGAFSFSKPTENKSSRFSSFFGGPAPAPPREQQKSVSSDSEPPSSAQKSLKEEHSAHSSRFFHGNSNKSTPQIQSPEIVQKPQERSSHGPPPGIQSKFQNFGTAPPQSPITSAAHGMVPQPPNVPPGFRMNPGPPQGPGMIRGPGPRGPGGTNDTFFLSLLNKSDGAPGPGPEGNFPMPMFPTQGVLPPADNQSFERGTQQFPQDKFSDSPKFSAPNMPGTQQQPKPSQYVQYQDLPMGMGMKPPPGMKPLAGPPGMYPPGMFPPGHQNQRPMPGQQGPQPPNEQGIPKQQLRGDVPPPWMRFGPNGAPGIVPPGYGQAPLGFPPGFPPVPPNNQQLPQQPQPPQGLP